jgi:hypothetical protein
MDRNELRQLRTILATEWPPILKIAQNRRRSILGPTD